MELMADGCDPDNSNPELRVNWVSKIWALTCWDLDLAVILEFLIWASAPGLRYVWNDLKDASLVLDLILPGLCNSASV